MGRNEEARKYIEKGLTIPDIEKDDAEVKALGRAELAKIP